MGLFDRFKRRVKEVSDEIDTEELTVEEDSIEGQQLASAKIQTEEETLAHEKQFDSVNNVIQTDEDDWEVFEDDERPILLNFKIQMTIGKILTMKKTSCLNNLHAKKRNAYRRNRSNWKRQKKPMKSQ